MEGIKLGVVVSNSTWNKTVGLPINKITATNLNLPMNQNFSFAVGYRKKPLNVRSHIGNWSLSDSTYHFTDEDSEDTQSHTDSLPGPRLVLKTTLSLTVWVGEQPEKNNSFKSLNHFNRIYPAIIIPTLQIGKLRFREFKSQEMEPKLEPLEPLPTLLACIAHVFWGYRVLSYPVLVGRKGNNWDFFSSLIAPSSTALLG